MKKFEQVLRQNLCGNYISFNQVPISFGNTWVLSNIQIREHSFNKNFKINSEIIVKSSKELSNQEIRSTSFRNDAQKFTTGHANEVAFNSLWFYNELLQSRVVNLPNIQQVATLKTYTFNTTKTKLTKKKPKIQRDTGSNIFERLRKLYRETVKIKINKTIMKKKKPCHLSNLVTDEAMFDALKEMECDFAKESFNIDRLLSNHLLKQAAKKQSPDPNVSLNSPCFPYIPCPLKKPEDYAMTTVSTCTYEHTSLAPLFTVDPLIINKEKKNDIEKELNCVKLNFWSQFANDKSVEIKEVSSINESKQTLATKSVTKPQLKDESSKVLPENEGKNVPKTCETKPFNTIESAELSHPLKTAKPKNPLQDSNPSKFVGKYYSVNTSKETMKREQANISQIKLPPNVFPKKCQSEEKIKSNKHLNLNFPYQMTSPNQAKRIKTRARSEGDLIKQAIVKEAEEKLSKGNVPKYNTNKLYKQLKKYYDKNVNDSNKTNKADKTELKQIIEKIAQQKTTDKKIKLQFPLTSPNTSTVKNKP